MLSLPVDSACWTVEDCPDLYMCGSQGCGCPVCRPIVIRRTFLELPNTVLMQMQLLDSHQKRKMCKVHHLVEQFSDTVCMMLSNTALLVQRLHQPVK